MKVGFLTGCLQEVPLDDVVRWASGAGFHTLELPAGPARGSRTKHLDVDTLDAAEAARIQQVFAAHNLTISSLAYYDNPMSSKPDERQFVRDHLVKVIGAAQLLGVELVGTFVGNDPTAPPRKTLEEAGDYFGDLCEYASERGVRLMIENCPMEGWQQPFVPGNLAYAPDQWDELFSRAPRLGLNFDPSHLYWLGIDYILAARDYGTRIFHAHAKDTEILPAGRQANGILGRGWWRYRVPGYGAIDWRAFVSTLWETGYTGPLSIEHEDPIWEGNVGNVKTGLGLGQRYLANILP
ncbi:MAG: IolE [Chloroflexi bacterium]|nr:IolE [Chloroflexota bacterium]